MKQVIFICILSISLCFSAPNGTPIDPTKHEDAPATEKALELPVNSPVPVNPAAPTHASAQGAVTPAPQGAVTPIAQGNVPNAPPQGNVPNASPQGNVPNASPQGNVPNAPPQGNANSTKEPKDKDHATTPAATSNTTQKLNHTTENVPSSTNATVPAGSTAVTVPSSSTKATPSTEPEHKASVPPKVPEPVPVQARGAQNNAEKNLLDLDTPVTLTNTVNIPDSNYSEAVDTELLMETTYEDDTYGPVQGRRIIDVYSFFKQIQTISNHTSLFDCNFSHISLLGERRNGLISKFKLKCNMCQKDFTITSDDTLNKHDVNVNIAAAIGITSAGIGYSQFEELTASMNIPIFTEVTYSQVQDQVYEKWELTAVDSMAAAAKREKDAAIAEGKLTKDGLPLIDVYADACWSARSYGNNYKALSGAAAIVGRRFGEVLFLGIKNKYCLVCARAEKKKAETPIHICFKNYTGSSSGMESETICQGFETSISMYNIVYGRLIADGDSATYAKILARNPYPNHTVKKIECRNHVLRNMCNKLKTLSSDTKYPLAHRKTLTQVKILSIRKVVLKSIEKHKLEKEKPEALAGFRIDVQNSVRHAYGDHAKCNNYYCSKEKTTQSNMEIENTLLWFRMQTIIQSVVSKSRSMLEDVDTNTVERFNSVIAKIVGGKRINFSLRRGYRARCNAAVVSFNNPYPKQLIKKEMLGKSPKKSILKRFEERRLTKRKLNKERPHQKNRMLKRNNEVQNDYGLQSITPDLSPQELKIAKETFLQNLKQLTSDREKIQLSTLNQRDSDDWVELRKNMITASNFGLIVKRRENTSKAKLVENILYKSNISNIVAIAHGVENEGLALKQLAIQEKVDIAPCGLFIDDEYPFIGATPDGVIGQDTIVEIKCPIYAYKNGLAESIKENKIQIWRYNKKTKLININKNSNWYYQIQGQLHVTRRNNCLFAVWSGENNALKTEWISRDDLFWEKNMKKKLLTFYMDWLLPEIVDSRRARGMPLREFEKTNEITKNDANMEKEPSPKRQRTDEEFLSIQDHNKENKPCCSRQILFENF